MHISTKYEIVELVQILDLQVLTMTTMLLLWKFSFSQAQLGIFVLQFDVPNKSKAFNSFIWFSFLCKHKGGYCSCQPTTCIFCTSEFTSDAKEVVHLAISISNSYKGATSTSPNMDEYNNMS